MPKPNCSIEGCEEQRYARGWCPMHYQRWRHFGDPLRERTERDRFMEKVNKTETCWLWTAFIKPNGYGQFKQNGFAHRYSYEFFVGPIPSGMEIDHLCKVTACVNPDHLEVVTRAENNRRSNSISALNMRKTHCKRGHPFSGDNLVIRAPGRSGRSGRGCRICINDLQRMKASARRKT